MDRTPINTANRKRSVAWSSVKTPGYHEKRRKGLRLPMNPHIAGYADAYSPTVMTYNGPRTQFQARGYTTPGTIWNNGGYLQEVAGIEKMRTDVMTQAEMKAELDNRIRAKVRDTPIDLGVALGEYRETANFIASAMVKTAQAAKAAYRGDLSTMAKVIAGRHQGSNVFSKTNSEGERRFLNVIKRDTSRWQAVPLSAGGALLAMNYGLKPLLSDVEGAMTALSRIHDGSDRGEYIFKTRLLPTRSSKKASNKAFMGSGPATAGIDWDFRTSGRAYARAGLENPILRSLDQLGLLNPISTGYELVPFSFVFDWFIPVGDLLRNFPEPKGIKFLDGFRVVKLEGTWREWTTITSSTPGWVTELNGDQKFKHREVYSSFPSYTLKPASLHTYRRRIANGAALLSQFLFQEEHPVGQPTRKDFRLLEPLGISRSEFRHVQRKFR